MAQNAKPDQSAHFQSPTTIRFCPNVAAAIGVSEAIVVYRLDYWLGRTKHHFDGRTWVYNTYESWQDQFPFWSRRTIQAIFRRLECLGIVESSQKYNRSHWDKTKWYSINYGRLSELMHQTRGTESRVADDSTAVPSTATEATIDETPVDILDGTLPDPIDDVETSPSWLTKNPSNRTSKKTLNRACVREPDAGARTPALEVTHPVVSWGHHEKKPVNELDVAYEAIPEAERQTWYERADQALEVTGMPEWMRITPTVKERALRMWVGSTIPGVATG